MEGQQKRNTLFVLLLLTSVAGVFLTELLQEGYVEEKATAVPRIHTRHLKQVRRLLSDNTIIFQRDT